MRYNRVPNREEAGAIGWVSLADALILGLIVVLTVCLLATGALQATRQENNRLRTATAIDPDEYARKVKELEALRKKADDEAALRDRLAEVLRERDRLQLEANAAAELKQQFLLAQAEIRRLATLANRENKFEGISTVGSSVVFVVDMSGSMKSIDEKTPAPTKWPLVVETITKVMRSLPDLKQYQIVVFSRSARYLFPAGWQKYTRDASEKLVREELLKADPEGPTNLYAAFDLAFRLKSDELDTIYFFSDGLPTTEPGLSEDVKALSENQRSDYLSKHVRQTLRTTWNPDRSAKRVKINSIGFFYESPEVGAFLWALSRENEGNFVGMSRP